MTFLEAVQNSLKWTIWQNSFGFRKMSPFALKVHSKQTRVHFFSREVMIIRLWTCVRTFRIHSEVHWFFRPLLKFWKIWNSNIQRLSQGHVTSRWLSGRQNYNLGWQKWWQKHIRFLIIVQLTQKPWIRHHKFCWNFTCNIRWMSVRVWFEGKFRSRG